MGDVPPTYLYPYPHSPPQTKDELKIAGLSTPNAIAVPVEGVLHSDVLYKMLPKEGRLVESRKWADHMVRSELMEFVRLLLLAGAVDVKWETMRSHVPVAAKSKSVFTLFSGSNQASSASNSGSSSPSLLLSLLCPPLYLYHLFRAQRGRANAATVGHDSTSSEDSSASQASSASHRPLRRLTGEGPPLNTTGRISLAGAGGARTRATSARQLLANATDSQEFWHLSRRPEWLAMVDAILSTGSAAGATFTLEHGQSGRVQRGD